MFESKKAISKIRLAVINHAAPYLLAFSHFGRLPVFLYLTGGYAPCRSYTLFLTPPDPGSTNPAAGVNLMYFRHR
jgi:hypothetical protein